MDTERWLKSSRISDTPWPITLPEDFCFIQITDELANLQMQQEMEYPGNPVKVAGTEKNEAKEITLVSLRD